MQVRVTESKMVNTNTSWYQYPNATDSRSLLDVFGYVNRTASDLFLPGILLVTWVIAFVSVFSASGSDRTAAARAWTFSSFFIALLSVPLVITGLLAAKFMYLTFIMVALGALWLNLGKDNL